MKTKNQLHFYLSVTVTLLLITPSTHGYYNLQTGRWLSRDPFVGSRDSYDFASNSAISAVDVLGLWDKNVHETRTKEWAASAGMAESAAALVGRWDVNVDKEFPTTTFTDFNWSWHFDRSLLGIGDTRLERASTELQLAKSACDWAGSKRDNAAEAAERLGRALHPLQDWVAHGDFNRRVDAPNIASVPWHEKLTYAHNYYTPQSGRGLGSVDDALLDSTGPDGRPVMSRMTRSKITKHGDSLYWAVFNPGSNRLKQTQTRTMAAVNNFLESVRSRSRSCGQCQKVFLRLHGPPAP